jgi:hypothetical protein
MTNFTTETQSTQRKPNRGWTQIYADIMVSLRSSQKNLADLERCPVIAHILRF